MKIKNLINLHKKKFDYFYKNFLISHLSKDLLSKAMIYASMNGGKRIRPFLTSIFSQSCGLKIKNSLYLSAAIESIHSYSLVHDDLPSMDDDDYRRGKLSTHKKFNEATAILTGDALHDLAFEIIANKKTHPDNNLRITLISMLAKNIGFEGLAGGQSLDLLFTNKKIQISRIIKMYEMKTSALFSFACSAPYILSKKTIKEINFAQDYGKIFGLIFQITDDILDLEKDFKSLGKTPGKDKNQGKSTLISLTNINKLKKFCLNEIQKFEKINKKYLKKNIIMKEMLYFNLERLN
jgi:geranylgeranyl pyrophosphate synthase